MERKIFKMTNYRTAAHWCGTSLILCNNIAEIDEGLWENCRFPLEDEDETPVEVYQFYLTDCSEDTVEYLERSFGLLFTYSEKLDLYVLCVDHWGTAWDYVPCPCYNEDLARNIPEFTH